MQSIDTNVVIRLIVQDDEVQGNRALALLRDALTSGGVWIAQLVLVETVWVLRSAYKFDRTSVATVLHKLIAVEGVTVEAVAQVQTGLRAFEVGTADFADYLILESSRRARALPLWTFDEKLAEATGVELVP